MYIGIALMINIYLIGSDKGVMPKHKKMHWLAVGEN